MTVLTGDELEVSSSQFTLGERVENLNTRSVTIA